MVGAYIHHTQRKICHYELRISVVALRIIIIIPHNRFFCQTHTFRSESPMTGVTILAYRARLRYGSGVRQATSLAAAVPRRHRAMVVFDR
jgi:hypothetical protein